MQSGYAVCNVSSLLSEWLTIWQKSMLSILSEKVMVEHRGYSLRNLPVEQGMKSTLEIPSQINY